jgi:hypothetical protein
MPVKTTENRYLPYLSDTYLADPLYKLYMLLFCTRDELLRARIKDLRRYKILPRQASVLMAVHTLGDNRDIKIINPGLPNHLRDFIPDGKTRAYQEDQGPRQP